jgi:hypothetical protein
MSGRAIARLPASGSLRTHGIWLLPGVPGARRFPALLCPFPVVADRRPAHVYNHARRRAVVSARAPWPHRCAAPHPAPVTFARLAASPHDAAAWRVPTRRLARGRAGSHPVPRPRGGCGEEVRATTRAPGCGDSAVSHTGRVDRGVFQPPNLYVRCSCSPCRSAARSRLAIVLPRPAQHCCTHLRVLVRLNPRQAGRGVAFWTASERIKRISN